MYLSRRRLIATAVLLLAAMLGAGVLAFQSTVGSVVLLLLCGAWVGVNQPFEGPVLVTVVRRKHGLTTADLVAVAGALVAIGALLNR